MSRMLINPQIALVEAGLLLPLGEKNLNDLVVARMFL
jgi:hypothetical protein